MFGTEVQKQLDMDKYKTAKVSEYQCERLEGEVARTRLNTTNVGLRMTDFSEFSDA